jgi:hypothetical protein
VSNSYGIAPPEKVRIGAGTALKFGFFAAFGVLFSLILSVVLGAVAVFLDASGTIDINNLVPFM